MKHYLFKDVPKGKRLSYFITYYKWHTLAAALAAPVVIVVIWLALSPRDDICILWVSDKYDIVAESVFRDKLEELPWDINGDGHIKPASQYIDITDDPDNMLEEERMTMVGLISAHTFNIYLLDEVALEHFTEIGVLGTWSDYAGAEVENGDEVFFVSCKDLPFFQDEYLEIMQDFYLAIAECPSEGEALETYRKQMDALKVITEPDCTQEE